MSKARGEQPCQFQDFVWLITRIAVCYSCQRVTLALWHLQFVFFWKQIKSSTVFFVFVLCLITLLSVKLRYGITKKKSTQMVTQRQQTTRVQEYLQNPGQTIIWWVGKNIKKDQIFKIAVRGLVRSHNKARGPMIGFIKHYWMIYDWNQPTRHQAPTAAMAANGRQKKNTKNVEVCFWFGAHSSSWKVNLEPK